MHLLYKGLLLLLVLFLGRTLTVLMKRWISGNCILRIDDQGITDNSALSQPFGFVSWRHIRRAHISSIGRNDFIELELYPEEPYLERLHGLRKKSVLANRKMGHQLVCISLNSTGASPRDVLPHIQNRLTEAGQ